MDQNTNAKPPSQTNKDEKKEIKPTGTDKKVGPKSIPAGQKRTGTVSAGSVRQRKTSANQKKATITQSPKTNASGQTIRTVGTGRKGQSAVSDTPQKRVVKINVSENSGRTGLKKPEKQEEKIKENRKSKAGVSSSGSGKKIPAKKPEPEITSKGALMSGTDQKDTAKLKTEKVNTPLKGASDNLKKKTSPEVSGVSEPVSTEEEEPKKGKEKTKSKKKDKTSKSQKVNLKEAKKKIIRTKDKRDKLKKDIKKAKSGQISKKKVKPLKGKLKKVLKKLSSQKDKLRKAKKKAGK